MTRDRGNLLVYGSLALFLVALYMVFLYVPSEATMKLAQRIFYFHVPAAVSSFVAFLVVCVASIQYLRTESVHWDRLAMSAAELGVVFAAVVLVTGPIWAKPIWGVFWRWEPRLTSMLILFSMYVAYLMVRQYGTDPGRTPRLAAVLGILAFANVPLVYFAVDLWAEEQQLHPQRGIGLAPEMRYTLWVSMVAVLSLFVLLLVQRYRLERLSDHLADLRRDHADAQPRS